ncbi:MAG: diphthine--ammonia ligase [Candidatus Methanofastidiosia archaeon]
MLFGDRMAFAQLSSGGKDSLYSFYLAREEGIDFSHILTVLPLRQDSYMFHFPNSRWAYLQARSIGVPHIEIETKGEKEKELDDLKNTLSKIEIDGICNGAIRSNYQNERLKKICKDLGIECVSPLWGMDEREVLKKASGIFDIMIVGVFAMGLRKELLGRLINGRVMGELLKAHEKYGVNPAGEGGEYETFVLDGPFFEKRIDIIDSDIIWKFDSGYLDIKDAKLVSKKT